MHEEIHEKRWGFVLEGPSRISFFSFQGQILEGAHTKKLLPRKSMRTGDEIRQFPVAGDQVRNYSPTTDEIANQQGDLGPGEFHRELISSNYFQRIGWKTPNTDCV